MTQARSAPDAAGRTQIHHVITGLGTGGAEAMLLKLVTSLEPSRFESRVVSLRDLGTLGSRIQNAGVPVKTLGLASPVDPAAARAVLRLRSMLRSTRPDVVQGWMYHGNLAASAAASLARLHGAVVWNIRQTVYRLADNSATTQLVIRLGAILSRSPAAIIYNSAASRTQHEALGYSPRRAHVIPNGFDCSYFAPRESARSRLRTLLGVGEETLVVGHVARYHPMKDHAGLLTALSHLHRHVPDVHLALLGTDVTDRNPALANAVAALGMGDRVHLLGERSDVAELMPGFDVACSSSAWGEGFPNVIGEAMSSGVPCVVTDVGDSALIVGDTGIVVRRSDPPALAEALGAMLALAPDERRRRGLAARARIEGRYSIQSVARQYEEIYTTVPTASNRSANGTRS